MHSEPLLEIGLDSSKQRLYEDRAKHSRGKIDALRSAISSDQEVINFKNITIYCAGSYARHEASKHSDVDLFFVSNIKRDEYGNDYHVPQIRLMSSIVNIGDRLEFPKFSNDGQFLQVIHLSDILDHLGGSNDDYSNFFTARLLLILESKSLYGDEVYNDCLDKIISSYFRDYPGHESEFRPNFLINDIVRFWKTLCLNYEHKRNQPTDDNNKKIKQKIKNFKLKYSRMMTCYASISYLTAYNEKITEEFIKDMVHLTPNNRMRKVSEFLPGSRILVRDVIEKYHWFLEITSKSEDDLVEWFSNEENRNNAFSMANEFGDAVYKTLEEINSSNQTFRYLVI